MKTTEYLSRCYIRDLEKLRSEIEQYPNDDALWIKAGAIPNSGGNLALHIIGNLNHFIGAVLGNSGYVRDRDREFSDSGISRESIIADVNSLIAVVRETLAHIEPETLSETFPINIFGEPETKEYILIHLLTHLNYHLGQIDYHRRLINA